MLSAANLPLLLLLPMGALLQVSTSLHLLPLMFSMPGTGTNALLVPRQHVAAKIADVRARVVVLSSVSSLLPSVLPLLVCVRGTQAVSPCYV